jgi:hypothetical protein
MPASAAIAKYQSEDPSWNVAQANEIIRKFLALKVLPPNGGFTASQVISRKHLAHGRREPSK